MKKGKDNMNKIQNVDQKPRLILRDDKVCTTSLAVAEFFGKQHFHVIRDIEALLKDCPEGFRTSNFGLTFRDVTGPNGAVRREKMYLLTKNGFVLLAMGFTGAKALAWKIRYIEAFDAMSQSLTVRHGHAPAGYQVRNHGVCLVDLLPLCGGYRGSAQVLDVLLRHGADKQWVRLPLREIVAECDDQITPAGVHYSLKRLVKFGHIQIAEPRVRSVPDSFRVTDSLLSRLEADVLPKVSETVLLH